MVFRQKIIYVKTCRGFSLVEMIVVMAILSVVMMAVMSLYIPAQRSTSMQTQVTDVQSNLRLALNRLTEDILTAGFLIGGEPIINNTATTLTIRTRLSGRGFARTKAPAADSTAGHFDITLSDPGMASFFPKGTKIRLFNPMSNREVFKPGEALDSATESAYAAYEADPTKCAARVYEVVGRSGAILSINTGAINLGKADIDLETVIVRVRDTNQPPVQTIVYQLVGGTLQRVVNGNTQFLARNVSAINFEYTPGLSGYVRRVDLRITGQTGSLPGNDITSAQKTRVLESSATVRNVF
jgi:prepilin-type N-terminal cleavage/methylation domain-containing protein